MFRNMKIEVNKQQTLDEIINELKRLGFVEDGIDEESISIATYFHDMSIDGYANLVISDVEGCLLTTLAELKEM